MTADELRRHVAFSVWASRRALEVARQLGPAKLDRDFGVSYGSVRRTLSHIYDGDRIWLARLAGEPPQGFTEPAPLPELERLWGDVLERFARWAGELTDADAGRRIAYVNTKGEPFEHTVSEIVLHAVNHASYHRGQVSALLRQLGHKPPNVDYIAYLRARAAGA